MKKVNVGIDLGTTYSAVATFSKELGRVEVYKNSFFKECTPSVVWIENGKVRIGEEAKSEQKAGNENTKAFYKNMMGNEYFSAWIDGKEYSAEDLSCLFLKELKKEIEETNGVKIDGAVITVPAYFVEAQRLATIRAGEKAGLRVMKIINEPTAAIIAYGLTEGKDKNVLVYDLGGGTFDVTVAHVKGTEIDVLSTMGNHQLGGKDWDQALIDEVKNEFLSEHGVDIENYPSVRNELQVSCEEAKKRLSTVSSTVISIQCEGYTGKYEITRETFEEKTETLLYQTSMLISSCFEDIAETTGKSFGWKDIDEVVLVGGSTRMPQVGKMILREYGKPPVTKDVNVDTIVACGAAMQAELCENGKLEYVIGRKKPLSGSNRSSNEMMTLTIKNSDIKDITSHSLGMLALDANEKDYINSIIIRKSSKINKEFSKEYTFAGDKLEVYVLQGESRDPYETDIIGKYVITGMTKGQKNIIVVNFLYNTNGVVEVNASIKNGKRLTAVRENVTEDMSALIDRLEREREETKQASRRVEIMLVIDTSGSMTCGGRMPVAKESAKGFIDQFSKSSNVFISVVAFADYSEYACKWSQNPAQLHRAIDKIESVGVGGATSARPIEDRYKQYSKDTVKIMVILTDGFWDHQEAEIASAAKAKKDDVIIYAIGIGEADEDFLNKVSSGLGKKVELGDLTKTFKEVAISIATEVADGKLK